MSAATSRPQRKPLDLRPYQRADLKVIYVALKLHRRVLYVLPTGAGKTAVVGRYIEQQVLACQRGLVIVPTVELLEQMLATCARFALDEEQIGVIWQHDRRTRPDAPLQIATIDTLRKRAKPPADFVVIDEADLSLAKKYGAELDGWYQNAKILGMTATPLRLDGRPMRERFDELVLGKSAGELCAMRDEEGAPYLLPARCWVPVYGRLIDVSGVRIQAGDYEKSETGRRSTRPKILAGCVQHLREHARWRSGFVFVCGIREIGKYVDAINADGRFKARGLHSGTDTIPKTPDAERRELLRPGGWLDSGTRRLVVTCDTISRGYDLPSAKLVVLARPTCSEALYRHQVGRALRPTTRNGYEPLVLDLTRNVLRFGRPQDPREPAWSLDAEKTPGRGPKNPAPKAKRCAACGEASPLGATECAACKAPFPARRPDEVAGMLVELVGCAFVDGDGNACGGMAALGSASSFRRGRSRPYCERHKGGVFGVGQALPCAYTDLDGHNCARPSTARSSWTARRLGFKSYCEDHKGGHPS